MIKKIRVLPGLSGAIVVCLHSIAVAAGDSLPGRIDLIPVQSAPSHPFIRAIAVSEGENNPAVLDRLRRLGINMIATSRGPNLETALAAEASGLSYLAEISPEDALRLLEEPEYLSRVSAVAAVPSFAGFQYQDKAVVEGYTSPAVQERVYRTIKRLFPSALVLHALRLDLLHIDPAFLDAYFRPEFTDVVAPYFYPVGTTTLGEFRYADDWERLLTELLSKLKERMHPSKGILPVLQAHEQVGYPLERGFARRQMEVYGRLWPSNRNVGAFGWDFRDPVGQLVSMDLLPSLEQDFRALLAGLRKPRRRDAYPLRERPEVGEAPRDRPRPSVQ